MKRRSAVIAAALLAGLAEACGEPVSSASCGDGVTQTGEACDDGNQVPADGCENDCTVTPPAPVCGNRVLELGEACDDGNQVSADGCENDCTVTPPVPVCGNGVLESGEACDDGNLVPADGCENDCTHSPDLDADGVPDALDNCPQDANPSQSNADGDDLGDSCDPCPAEPGIVCTYSIYELRQGGVAFDSTVRLRDLAVTAVAANGYYVQVPPDAPDYAGAANSGLFVFSGTGPKPAAGDRVDVEGTLTNYYGRLELTDTVFTPAGTSGASPEPAIVEPADAATASAVVNGVAVAGALQSVLIKVQNVTVTNASPAVNEFEVTGGLPVDDLLYRLDPLPSVGQSFSSITGVLDLYLNRYALEPRGAADISGM